MRIGIAGYGNLGKSVHRTIEKLRREGEKGVEVGAIFSRREVGGELRRKFEEAEVCDLDVVILCLGSYRDLQENLHYFAKFDTVDAFDEHGKMQQYKKLAEKIKGAANCALNAAGTREEGTSEVTEAESTRDEMMTGTADTEIGRTSWEKIGTNRGGAGVDEKAANLQRSVAERGTITVTGVGWDPGVLSLARCALGLCCDKVATVWGRGISLGHSNALRSLPQVADGVQVTVPKIGAKRRMAKGAKGTELHKRICYVVCQRGDRQKVKMGVASLPEYFAGSDVRVKFCNRERLKKIKKNTHHRGRILARGQNAKGTVDLAVKNNARLTAEIMVKVALAIPEMKRRGMGGVLDLTDIPLCVFGRENLL